MSDGPKVGDVYYRYDDGLYLEDTKMPPHLLRYRVEKVTPCGAWIRDEYLRRRFILSRARKKYAYPTLEEAKESYRIRKRNHVWHCEYHLEKAKYYLQLAENL